MQERIWIPEINKTLVCVDSYEKGIPVGRFYNHFMDMESFESLSQFLLKMEESMDDRQIPQSYTATRTFADMVGAIEPAQAAAAPRRGRQATFEVMVLFRQHTSWQGVVRWQEGKSEQSFRSVLELIRLMDSALKAKEECE